MFLLILQLSHVQKECFDSLSKLVIARMATSGEKHFAVDAIGI